MREIRIAVAVLLIAGCAKAQKDKGTKLETLGPVRIAGDVGGEHDVSGAAFVGEFLLLVSNETGHVEVLKKHGDGYKVTAPVVLEKRKPGAKEHHLDLEAIAADGDTVYALGSHSRASARSRTRWHRPRTATSFSASN